MNFRGNISSNENSNFLSNWRVDGDGGISIFISSIVSPTTQDVTYQNTWSNLFLVSSINANNYTSTAGTISSVVAQVSINGGIWVNLTSNENTALTAGSSVSTRIVVTDSASNVRIFAGGSSIVSGLAPTVTASDSLLGRVLTITTDSFTGIPNPTITLTTLTLDGANVLNDATGGGPWEYIIPDSDSPQTITWVVNATNFEGSDTATDSEIVAANLFAPVVTGSISNQIYPIGVAIAPLNISSEFTGTSSITYTVISGPLPTGLSLSSSGTLSGTPTTETATSPIVIRGSNAYGFDDITFNIEVVAEANLIASPDGTDTLVRALYDTTTTFLVDPQGVEYSVT